MGNRVVTGFLERVREPRLRDFDGDPLMVLSIFISLSSCLVNLALFVLIRLTSLLWRSSNIENLRFIFNDGKVEQKEF